MVKITQSMSRKKLEDVDQDKQFWCSDGRVLKNLTDLKVALEQMSADTFRYHSNEAKNDFSNWTMDVFGDKKLAMDLRKSTTQTQAAKCVADKIAWLMGK